MNGERHDAGVACEDFGGSVSLVYIKVDNCRAPGQAFLAQKLNGDRDIVKNAESRAFSSKSVVRASAKGCAPSGLDRILCRAQSAAYRGQRPLCQRRRPGETNAPHRRRRHATLKELVYVIGVMRELDNLRVGEGRTLKLERAILGKQRKKLPLFVPGKLVICRERRRE